MPNASCFVPGCRTGYPSDRKQRKLEGKRYLSLFRAPRDDELRRKWKVAILRADKELTSNAMVCEVHFQENDIETHYVTKLPNGHVHRMKRGCPVLKKDAVPSIFPSFPKYLIKDVEKRKPPVEHNSINQNTKKLKLEKILEHMPIPGTEVLKNIREPSIDFSFSVLSENLSKLRKPNKLWGVSYHDNFIICVKWNEKFVAERKLVFHDNLKYRVFMYDVEITNMESKELHCLEDVSRLLQTVQNYILCASIIKGCRKEDCLIIIRNNGETHRGRPSIWCKSCNIKQKKLKAAKS